MYLNYIQAIQLAETYCSHIASILSKDSLILCPSYDALATISQHIIQTNIALGAQDCSAQCTGAYTGQVNAQSLAQLGCTYCIVGHSELRSYQTNQDIIKKIQHLFDAHISLIICISSVDKVQLEPIMYALESKIPAIVAYEPLAAIGTGVAATIDDVKKALSTLINNLAPYQHMTHYRLVYGGSVNSKNVAQFKHIADIDGFLIGHASINAHEMRAIIAATT